MTGQSASRDSSEGEASESDESSIAEEATEEASEMETPSAGGSTVIGNQERAVFLTKHSESDYSVRDLKARSLLSG